jgi:uncharacterized membrane protein YkoI
MSKKAIAALAGAVTLALAGAGIATAGTAPSRLDDGAQYLSQAKITEAQAIAAAQNAASGALNEVDLERSGGRLVFNVDVGDADVKVDASTGEVVSTARDD